VAEREPVSQERVDRLITELLAGLPEEEAVYVAAVLANRAATELHKRARAAASQRKGQAAWGAWAGLQNAARGLVLQSSTCRDSAAALTGRSR
jgi:hypothetical protein